MNQLNARIILRNDGLSVWESNKTVVLARGEFGIAYDENNKARLKIGDGKTPWSDLEWFGGENNVYDGVTQEQLDALKEELDALSERVGQPAGENTAATGIYAEIAALAESMGLLDETRVNELIDEKIDAFANQITDDGKTNTLMELIDYVNTHGEEAAAIVADVNTLRTDIADIKEIVGDTPIADQVANALVQENVIKEIAVNGVLCDVVDGRVDLNVTATGTGVVSGDEIAVNEDGTLSIVKIDMSKLTTDESTTVVLNGGSASV